MPLNDQKWIRDELAERRRGPRYRMTAEVIFRWQSSPGTWRTGKGVSKDISGHGISVISSSIPVPGAEIEATVHMPVVWSQRACLRGRGTVLRLQPATGQPWGFAASLQFEDEIYEGYWEEAATGAHGDHNIRTSTNYNSPAVPYSPIRMGRSERYYSDARFPGGCGREFRLLCSRPTPLTGRY